MLWKVLLAVFLILVLWLLYTNDYSAQKSVDSLKTRASSLVGSATPSASVAAPTPAAPAPAPAPAPEQPKKEGFCPKLMQKYGFCNAGENMNSTRGTFYDSAPMSALPTRGLKFEGLTSNRVPVLGDVAGQTQWGGYMSRSALPNF